MSWRNLVIASPAALSRKIDKRRYVQFRQFLIQDGYDMLQWSVYSRICNGMDNANKRIARLAENAPKKGSAPFDLHNKSPIRAHAPLDRRAYCG